MTMERLRVLVVTSKYFPEYSGSGRRAHLTYKRLQRKFGIAFDVLTGSITSNSSALYTHEGVSVRRIACKPLPVKSLPRPGIRYSLLQKAALRINYWSEAIRVWRYLARALEGYDLVHVFGNAAVTSAAITFCNITRKPLIVELCCEMKRPAQYRPLVVRLIDRQRSGFHPRAKIVCISRKLEEMCLQNGIPAKALWTRPNPVDTSIFSVAERGLKYELRRKYTSFNESDILLVNISKFMPSKNQAFLLEVLLRLPQEYKLLLAGPVTEEGPNASRDREFLRSLREKAGALGLQTRIMLKPEYIDNPAEYIKMSDVYVFPTMSEGLGTPLIESICCGVPVVATRISGVTDTWLKEGVNGYLSGLDPEEFAGKVVSARRIPPASLAQGSRQMAAAADAQVIDSQYYRIITEALRK